MRCKIERSVEYVIQIVVLATKRCLHEEPIQEYIQGPI